MEQDDLHARISAAHGEALQVGDSPTRADRLAGKLPELAELLKQASVSADLQARIADSLAHAERVLRRDDDGREAARHLQSALHLLVPRRKSPSPFLDDG
jgi:hypothetical protein